MNNLIQAPLRKASEASVVALHCSLGSGRQWAKLAEELGRNYRFITPDISGYGTNTCALELPLTLAEEVRCLSGHLNDATGPIHLIGHSYGGAIAFKIATASPFAHRMRSLTLIEPVLPTLLRESEADRRLHDRFDAALARGFRRPLERIGAGGDRQVHRVLEWIRPARSAAGERAASDDRACRQAGLRFHRGAWRRKRLGCAVGLRRMPTLLFSGGTVALSHPAHCAAARRRSSAARKSGICRLPATCCR